MTETRGKYSISYEHELARQVHLAGLPAPVLEHRYHPTRRWRFDLAFPSHMLAVEVDGGVFVRGCHNTGVGYTRDCVKLNEAVLLGWRVLRVTPEMVQDGTALQYVHFALNGVTEGKNHGPTSQ